MTTQYVFTINEKETNEETNEIIRLRDKALKMIGYSIVISPSRRVLFIKGNHDALMIANLIKDFEINNIITL